MQYGDKETVRVAWIVLIAILALTIVAEHLVHMHPHFEFEAYPYFHAWFGFGACAAIVVGSKLLGYVLKRKEDYYQNKEQP